MSGNSRFKKIVALAVSTIFIGICIIPSSTSLVLEQSNIAFYEGDILYVGGGGPGNYSTIQAAIDNASDGDTVFVYAGIYYENIFVDKKIDLIGEDKYITIIDGGNKHDVVHIRTLGNSVKLSGFTIQNSGNVTGAGYDAGVEIHSHNNIISNNIITKHQNAGIIFFASNGNNITDNIIHHNGRSGVSIWSSNKNIISKNNISYNEGYGIFLDFIGISKDNIISDNTFFSNFGGLDLYQSGNMIYSNNFVNNTYNAMSHFNLLRVSPSRNTWNGNYWDDWIGFGPKFIRGFLGFNFDWHPVKQPNKNGWLI